VASALAQANLSASVLLAAASDAAAWQLSQLHRARQILGKMGFYFVRSCA